MYQNVEPPGNMAVQCPCFLVLNSNGWADFLSNPVLPFHEEDTACFWLTMIGNYILVMPSETGLEVQMSDKSKSPEAMANIGMGKY